MGILIFWLVLFFPVAEVLVLTRVGARIGFWDTLFLLILSGVVGSYLAKVQGKMALQRIQACMAEGRIPTHEMVDGMLIFIGGLLFAFPGFISDALGLLLIFPPTRVVVRFLILGSLKSNLTARHSYVKEKDPSQPPGKAPISRQGAEDAEIIE